VFSTSSQKKARNPWEKSSKPARQKEKGGVSGIKGKKKGFGSKRGKNGPFLQNFGRKKETVLRRRGRCVREKLHGGGAATFVNGFNSLKKRGENKTIEGVQSNKTKKSGAAERRVPHGELSFKKHDGTGKKECAEKGKRKGGCSGKKPQSKNTFPKKRAGKKKKKKKKKQLKEAKGI